MMNSSVVLNIKFTFNYPLLDYDTHIGEKSNIIEY
jgi:hypothetical protein